MRRLRFFPLALPLVFGCGGQDGSRPNDLAPAPYADTFVGRWSGTWQQRRLEGRGGTLTVEIARTATFSEGAAIIGTVAEPQLGQASTTGTVYDNGEILILFDENNGNINQGFHDRYVGNRAFSIDSRGHVVGTLRRQQGDLMEETDFDLAPVTP